MILKWLTVQMKDLIAPSCESVKLIGWQAKTRFAQTLACLTAYFANGFYRFPAGKPKAYHSPQLNDAQTVVNIIPQAFDVDSGVVRLGCP